MVLTVIFERCKALAKLITIATIIAATILTTIVTLFSV